MTSSVIDLIDAFGSRLKRWPEEARARFEAEKHDPKVRRHMKRARKIDKRLSEWKEDKDGAEIPDDTPPPPAAEPEPVPMGMEEAEPDFGEIPDVAKALQAIIADMMTQTFSDQEYIRYTSDYDLIEVVEPAKWADPAKLEEKVNKIASVMQKDLQRIVTARSLSVMQPGLRRGRINPSALHRMEVNDDRVFRKKIENQSKDVAVSLVIDFSGSMHGAKYQLAIQSAWAFAAALDALNIKSEIIGFTTYMRDGDGGYFGSGGKMEREGVAFAKSIGKSSHSVQWEPVFMPIMKTFDERFGMEQKRRMATMYDARWYDRKLMNNIDGTCVQIAAKRLAQQPAKRKLMMVFSDGQPAGHMDNDILWSHLKKVIGEVEAIGIETVGVGIMSESVEQFYPKNFVVRNIQELPAKVMGELKNFLLK